MVSQWRVRRMPLAAAVLLILLTLPLGVSAAPRSEDRAARQTWFGVWRAIPDLWQTIQGFFENAGSSPDPFGNANPIVENEGSSPDPFGNPKPVYENEGSSLDPFGNPRPNNVTDPPAASSLAEH